MPAAAPTTPSPPEARYPAAARGTYNALRLGMIALPLFLGIAVVWVLRDYGPTWAVNSISAHYYSPIRDVFVGTLVAMGVILIAIKGREPLEDPALNAAGMFAPVVALVPVAVTGACPDQWTGCDPATLWPQIDRNFGVLLIVGAVALVVVAVVNRIWVPRTPPPELPPVWWRRWLGLGIYAIGLLLYLGLALFFVLGRQPPGYAFYLWAHNVAAIGLFGLVGVVAFAEGVAAIRNPQEPEHAVLPDWAFRLRVAGYFGISLAIGGVLLAWALSLLSFFWVEMALMSVFVLFWVLQTFQYWRTGGPELEERSAPQ